MGRLVPCEGAGQAGGRDLQLSGVKYEERILFFGRTYWLRNRSLHSAIAYNNELKVRLQHSIKWVFDATG